MFTSMFVDPGATVSVPVAEVASTVLLGATPAWQAATSLLTRAQVKHQLPFMRATVHPSSIRRTVQFEFAASIRYMKILEISPTYSHARYSRFPAVPPLPPCEDPELAPIPALPAVPDAPPAPEPPPD